MDDNEYNIFVLHSYSNILKIPHEEAHNGQEAIEKVKALSMASCCKSYKLILMDINMPILNGIEATLLIRKLENSYGIEKSNIVAVSAQDTERGVLQDKLEDLGFDSLEGKPISKKAFQRMLQAYNV